jgi:hypothetical protein
MKHPAPTPRTLSRAALAAGLAALLGLAGCSKVTQENYDQLKMGMEYAEVVNILGEPEQCESLLTAKNCVWGKDPKTITIQLVSEKVILFQAQGL